MWKKMSKEDMGDISYMSEMGDMREIGDMGEMGEVELIDEALDGCYKLQNRISILLAKLNDINEVNSISIIKKDFQPNRSRSSRKRKSKNKNKSKLYDSLSSTLDMRSLLLENSSIEAETSLSNMFAKLSDSFIEENSEAYSRSFNMESDSLFYLNYDDCSKHSNSGTKMLSKLNDIIVKVNAENLKTTKAMKLTPTKKNRQKSLKSKKLKLRNFKTSCNAESTPVRSNLNLTTDLVSEIGQESFHRSYYASDVESNDSGYSSGVRSLQEINSTYAKIDKRLIEVKRSVESVVVGMKHVDEIINRQKGVFHLNYSENESFVCRH